MKPFLALLSVILIVTACEAQKTGKTDIKTGYEITKTDAEWRRQLSKIQFDVTRKKGTEAAYSGIYWNNHQPGTYNCICCELPLFSSATKFESGTGWPSFWQPISSRNIEELDDNSFGMTRTEVNCKRCGAHLGHVFNDGPRPTGLRYCMNSASLNFIKKQKN